MRLYRLNTELRRFLRNWMSRAALAVAVAIPLLYGALYLWAFWNPTGHLDRLPVAIVDADTGANQGDGKAVDAGAELTRTLTDGHKLDWHATDAADARQGLEAGRYYAVLTIPADFSRAVTTAGTEAPTRAPLEVTYNDANGYTARTIVTAVLGQVRTSVSDSLGEAMVSKLLVGYGDIHAGVAKAADGAASLATGADQATAGAGSVATGASQVAAGAHAAADGAARLQPGSARVADGAATLADGLPAAAAGAAKVSDGAGQLSAGVGRLAQGLPAAQQAAGRLATGSSDVAAGAGKVADGTAALATALRELAAKDPALAPLAEQAGTLASGSTQVAQGARQVALGDAALATSLDAATQGATSAAGGARSLASGAADLSNQLSAARGGASQLAQGARQVADGTAALADRLPALASGADQLSSGATSLRDGVGRLGSGAKDLASGLTDAAGRIPTYDAQKARANAAMMASPVALDTDFTHQAEGNGEGFAPYFIGLALYVGALILWMLLRPISQRALAAPVRVTRVVLAGIVPALIIGTAQVALLVAVLLLGLGLATSHVVAFVGFALLVSAAFIALQQAIYVWFGTSVGRLIVLVLLMLQLTSAGGTYPAALSPGFFQSLHAALPMTQVVTGFREAITGSLGQPFATAVASLAALALGSVVVAIVGASRNRVWTMGRLHPVVSL